MENIIKMAFLALFIVGIPLSAHAEFKGSYVGETKEYKSNYEDTFVHLARDYGLGFVEMRAANPGVDPWLPGNGTDLILPTRHLLPDAPHEGVVINLPDMRLYAFVNGDEAPISFPLGVGRDGLETPEGTTEIARKVAGPTWYPTERMRKEKPELPAVVPPGAENPMGDYALYLGWPQYAIHGTNRPFGIGRRISSGCIRMYPEDIESVYQMIPIGTKVTVVNQPVKAAWIDGELYVEANPVIEQAAEMEETGQVRDVQVLDKDIEYIRQIAGEHADEIDWDDVKKILKEVRTYPIKVAKRSPGDVPAQEVSPAGVQEIVLPTDVQQEKPAQESAPQAEPAKDEVKTDVHVENQQSEIVDETKQTQAEDKAVSEKEHPANP